MTYLMLNDFQLFLFLIAHPLRARAFRSTAGITSTLLQIKVEDHLASFTNDEWSAHRVLQRILAS